MISATRNTAQNKAHRQFHKPEELIVNPVFLEIPLHSTPAGSRIVAMDENGRYLREWKAPAGKTSLSVNISQFAKGMLCFIRPVRDSDNFRLQELIYFKRENPRARMGSSVPPAKGRYYINFSPEDLLPERRINKAKNALLNNTSAEFDGKEGSKYNSNSEKTFAILRSLENWKGTHKTGLCSLGWAIAMLIAFAFGAPNTASAQTMSPFSLSNLDSVLVQDRHNVELDSMSNIIAMDTSKIGFFYTTPTGDTLPFLNSEEGDSIFNLITTEGDTIFCGKVDTVYGEGTWDDTAWRVIMNGVMQEGLPKIRTITEEWAFDFLTLLDADTSYHDLGSSPAVAIYPQGRSPPPVTLVYQVVPPVYTISYSEIELSIQEMHFLNMERGQIIFSADSQRICVTNVGIIDIDLGLSVDSVQYFTLLDSFYDSEADTAHAYCYGCYSLMAIFADSLYVPTADSFDFADFIGHDTTFADSATFGPFGHSLSPNSIVYLWFRFDAPEYYPLDSLALPVHLHIRQTED